MFCVTTLMYQSTEDYMDLVHLKKDRMEAPVYKQLFMEIRNKYRDINRVYTNGSRADKKYVACPAVYLSDTVISMRLPN